GEVGSVELAPAAELASEYREAAALALDEETGERPPIGELVPVDRFRAPLELIAGETAVVIAGDEEIEPALRDHWDDVTASMHDEDARKLYVDVAEPLSARAALRMRTPRGDAEDGDAGEPVIRAQVAISPARSLTEAEGQLERELRSG